VHILSLQSHVAYGHAGNSAAVFPLQRLGIQVTDINLLSFSNHLGYETWSGDILPVEQLNALFEGLEKINVLHEFDCILSGYIASKAQAESIAHFVKKVKQCNPNVIYCCDPVIGDDHMGIYVDEGVAEVIKTTLVPMADIITPNTFELAYLTGKARKNTEEMEAACKQLHQGKHITMATSFGDIANEVGILMFDSTGDHYISTPKYTLPRTAVGSGDVTTALFLGHYLPSRDAKLALEKTANGLHAIAQFTHENNLAELAIVQCQEAFAAPSYDFLVAQR
jgi:pyridoxine kinase